MGDPWCYMEGSKGKMVVGGVLRIMKRSRPYMYFLMSLGTQNCESVVRHRHLPNSLPDSDLPHQYIRVDSPPSKNVLQESLQ